MDDKDHPEKTRTQQSSGGTTRMIGPYHLLQKIGEGGMGEVWVAEQHKPIHRRVALKLIKAGMDTKQVIARFESERQALAMMDHPAIAKVFEAGETDEGRPYFVMEYIQGIPITVYCDQNRLTTQERLELFELICEGVQHAHQKAVIHRDLKPSNILVAIQDRKAVPKIIDFGVAKATAQSLTERTMYTELGMLIGTPEYMSPEQAEMSGQNIDTRTDVYSLGAILYELLVGVLPFDPKELRRAGYDEIRRKIREEDPPKPSTKLSTMGDASTKRAQNRQTNATSLIRQIRGDLDWITMKALEKDRTRRYNSPLDLAADIERYRTNQPVLASPPSAVYRASKFVRRHTGGVAVAATSLVVLVVFAVTMTVQAGRIAAERDRANQEAEAKGQVSEFLENLFTVSDPGEARGNTITARELLDQGAEKIKGMLAEQPETRADLMATIGTVYRKLGLFAQAEPLLEQALAERERVLGHDHPNTLISANNLASLYENQGRYSEAESLFLETLETQKRVLGYDHPGTLRSMNNLAVLYERQGRYDEAEPLYLETLKTQKRVLGDDHPATLTLMGHLAVLYNEQGRYDEAERLFLETIEAEKRVFGDDHPHTLASIGNLAVLYKDHDHYDKAEPLLLVIVDIAKRVLGGDHPATLSYLGNLADLYQRQGLYEKAEPLFLETLQSWKRVLGEDHPDTGITIHNLACLYRDQGRPAESKQYFERAQQIFVAALGPEHPYVAENLSQWAALLRKIGDNTAADGLEARARAIRGK